MLQAIICHIIELTENTKAFPFFSRKDDSMFIPLLRKMIAEFKAKNLDSDGLEILRSEDRDLYPSPNKICEFLATLREKFGRPLGGKLGSTCAKSTPEPSPKIIPETIPETEPEIVSETVPETVPETIPEPVVETIPETVPETVPETAPEAVPETAPEAVPEIAPEAVPEAAPETVPEAALETVPETAPETVRQSAEIVPETVPETISETVLEAISFAIPEESNIELSPEETVIAVEDPEIISETEPELPRGPKELVELDDDKSSLPPCQNILPKKTESAETMDIENLGQLWYGSDNTNNLIVPGVTCYIVKETLSEALIRRIDALYRK